MKLDIKELERNWGQALSNPAGDKPVIDFTLGGVEGSGQSKHTKETHTLEMLIFCNRNSQVLFVWSKHFFSYLLLLGYDF